MVLGTRDCVAKSTLWHPPSVLAFRSTCRLLRGPCTPAERMRRGRGLRATGLTAAGREVVQGPEAILMLAVLIFAIGVARAGLGW